MLNKTYACWEILLNVPLCLSPNKDSTLLINGVLVAREFPVMITALELPIAVITESNLEIEPAP